MCAMTTKGLRDHKYDGEDVDFSIANGPNLLNTEDGNDTTDGDDSDDTRANPPMVVPQSSGVAHNAGCRCSYCSGPVPNPSAL